METELTYDVDNFSGKHYKTEPNIDDYVDPEGYLDDPNDNPSSGNGWDDLVSDLGGDEKAAEEEYSWMLHDNQPVAPGVGGFYNVGQRGVEKDVDDAIMMNNRRLYGTNNRIGDLARKRWVNGRTPGDMEDWTDDMRYLHPEAFEESKLRGIVREAIRNVVNEATYVGNQGEYYYFCAYKDTFDKGSQVVKVDSPEYLEKVANRWRETNGYPDVWVYDMNHNCVGNFSSPKFSSPIGQAYGPDESKIRRVVRESLDNMLKEGYKAGEWNEDIFRSDLRAYIEMSRDYDGSAGYANAKGRKMTEVIGDLPWGVNGREFEMWLVTHGSFKADQIDQMVDNAVDWVRNKLESRPKAPRIF